IKDLIGQFRRQLLLQENGPKCNGDVRRRYGLDNWNRNLNPESRRLSRCPIRLYEAELKSNNRALKTKRAEYPGAIISLLNPSPMPTGNRFDYIARKIEKMAEKNTVQLA